MLATELKKHLYEVRALPNYEVEEWRAFLVYRQAMEEFAMKKAER